MKLVQATLFQSPCGEVIVKAPKYSRPLLRSRNLVSVPLRGSDRERCLMDISPTSTLTRFQSPCGEVIVKDVLFSGKIPSIYVREVSVPLRGSDRESCG